MSSVSTVAGCRRFSFRHVVVGFLFLLPWFSWRCRLGVGGVELFSPQGFNKDVRQVAVRFSEAMVALGDPDLAEPFVVDCPVPGTGRWLDHRNWVYDFEYDVPGAVRCPVRVAPGRRGRFAAIAWSRRSTRSTPADRAFWTTDPRRGAEKNPAVVDERQVFLLALDGVAGHCRHPPTRPMPPAGARRRYPGRGCRRRSAGGNTACVGSGVSANALRPGSVNARPSSPSDPATAMDRVVLVRVPR